MLLARAYSAYRPANRESVHHHRFGIAVAASMSAMIFGVSAFAAAKPPLDPSGLWSTKDDESIIRIGPCAPPSTAAAPGAPIVYCGIIVWLKEPLEKGVPKIDSLNPDPAKKGKPILGMEVFSEFAVDSDHWKGKAYNSDDGKTWDVTFKVLPDKTGGDKGEITGCLVWPLCKSETFTKVQVVPGGEPTLPSAAASAPHTGAAKTPAAPKPH